MLAASTGAPAQNVSSSAATATPAENYLQEIVVTAQKREELAQDVPTSLIVLSGASLLTQNADKLEDYVARIPGISLDARGLGQQQLTIRGISTGPQYASTVATYIDEAPVGASNGDGTGGLITPDIDSIDLARIEVLRGPQGTLYGASNIGGLLKYVTLAPDLTRFGAVVAVDGDTLAHGGSGFGLKGRVNIPLADGKAALLVSGYDRRDPGFISDSGRNAREVDETRTRGARVAILASPMEGLTIRAAAVGQNRRADGFSAVDADPQTLQPVYGDYQQRRVPGSENYDTEVRLYYLTVGYDFGWGQFTETTSYNTVKTRSSQDYTQQFGGGIFGPPYDAADLGFTAAYDISQSKLTEEVRLSGTAGRLDWVVGAYYTHENSDTGVAVHTVNTLTGAPVVLPSLLDANTQGHYLGSAGFAQLTFHATPKLAVTVGGRYAHDHLDDAALTSGALVGPASVTPSTASDSVGTYTFAPTYKLSDNLTSYVRIASGFRPGGANAGFAPAPVYGPDRVTNYEFGFKGEFLEHRLSFDVDAFHVKWTGVQLQLRTAEGLGYTADAGEASSSGVEGNIAFVPTEGLTLRASATYTDAKLQRDLVASSSIGFKGNALPYSPPWKAVLSGDYTRAIAGEWTGFVGASIFHTGKVSAEFATDPTVPRIRFPSYTTADARVGVTYRHLNMSLIGKNLFDTQGFNGQTPLTLSAAGTTALSIIQPRALVLSATYSY